MVMHNIVIDKSV